MISNNETDDWGPEAAHEDTSEVATSIDMMQVVMRRKGLIALGMFVGICLAILYYAQADPIYESNAMMSIKENNPARVTGDSLSGLWEDNTAAADHAIHIASEVIINQALELTAPNRGIKLTDLPTLAASEHPVQDIYNALTVQPFQDGSEILTLSFRGKNPEDCAEILGTLIGAYSSYLTEDRGNIEANIVTWIKTAKEELSGQLDDLQKQLVKAQYEQSDVVYLSNGDELILPQQAQLKLSDERDALEAKVSRIRQQIKNITSLLRQDERPDFDLPYRAVLMGHVRDDLLTPEQSDYYESQWEIEKRRIDARNSERLLPLVMRDLDLAQRYGVDHPARKSIREQIVELESYRDENAFGEETLTDREEDKQDLLEYLDALKYRLTDVSQELQAVNYKLEEATKAAKEIKRNTVEIARLQAEIQRKEDLHKSIVENLNQANLVQQYGDDNKIRVTLLQHASLGERVAPNIFKCLAAGSMLGFLSGFGLGYLVEVFDKTFRSPQEVSKALQLPLIGHIPEIEMEPVEGSKISETLVAYHQPKSPLSENFRAIRTALYFSTGGSQHRVIQTTSPVPGDGKSTLTANLAVTIAQSNKRVLLLDADFRRPTLHRLFGTSKDVGLASVVAGDASPEHAIQATEVPNLSVMACGPRPDNPSELLTSPEFESLVRVLREQYDFVLIDTPPVLAVTDPGIVSARVDGVIMALRIRKNGRPSALRARKILSDLDANILGIVVNGIDQRAGSYGYYSSYRRGYGASYAYNYGNDKTEQLIGKYFEEPVGEGAEGQELSTGTREGVR